MHHMLKITASSQPRSRATTPRVRVLAGGEDGGEVCGAGLQVQAELDAGEYPTGVKVTEAQMDAIALVPDAFHGDWNYKLVPRRS